MADHRLSGHSLVHSLARMYTPTSIRIHNHYRKTDKYLLVTPLPAPRYTVQMFYLPSTSPLPFHPPLGVLGVMSGYSALSVLRPTEDDRSIPSLPFTSLTCEICWSTAGPFSSFFRY